MEGLEGYGEGEGWGGGRLGCRGEKGGERSENSRRAKL